MPSAVVDLFCGVGGLTHGLQRAGLNVIAGVDFEERHDNIVAVTDQVITLIYAAMSIPNIWTKPTNVNDLRGKIGTTLRFSGIQQLKENSESIVTELIKLAKSNESVLRSFV